MSCLGFKAQLGCHVELQNGAMAVHGLDLDLFLRAVRFYCESYAMCNWEFQK